MMMRLHRFRNQLVNAKHRCYFSAWIKHYRDKESIPGKTSDPPILFAPLPDKQGKPGEVAYCLHHTGGPSISSSSFSVNIDHLLSIHRTPPNTTTANPSSSSIPLIIAVHGAPGSTFDWRYMGTLLEPAVKLLRFIVPGHAETSESTTSTPSAKHLSETLWRTMDILSTMEQHNITTPSTDPSSSPLSSSSSSSSSAIFAHPVYLLSHSLGHEVIAAMCHERPHLIKGIICVSPVGIRPHAAIRPWNIVRMIGHLSYRQGFLRWIIDRYLYFLYVYGFGFPKRITYREAGWCAQRVAFRNYGQMRSNIKEIVKLGIPVFLSHAKDDKIVEETIFMEVLKSYESTTITDNPRSRTINNNNESSRNTNTLSMDEGKNNDHNNTLSTPSSTVYHNDESFRKERIRVVYFDHGGHMLVKNQASILGNEIVQWINDIENGTIPSSTALLRSLPLSR